jgi:DNA-directed RNA polymerase specialized sigma24 family protein
LRLLGAASRKTSDEQLRQALVQGQREVVIPLCWTLFSQPLFLRIVSAGIPADQAEDVLQNVFGLLHREYETVRGPKLRAWLRTMADYECLRHIQACRRLRRYHARIAAEHDQGEIHRDRTSPEVAAEQRCSLRVTLDFLGRLSPYEAALLESTLVEEHSVAETQEWLFKQFGARPSPEQLVRQRHRLRRRLTRHIAAACSGKGKVE